VSARGDIAVRPESDTDAASVRALLLEAFETSAEADLVDALRSNARPYLALVAVADGELVGHVAFTSVAFDPMRDRTGLAVGLAPLAVASRGRGRGIGALLVSAGLEACREAGAGLVVVLGDPAYYGRFGFEPASKLGLRSTYDAPEEAFMAIALRPFAVPSSKTTVLFRPEFDVFG
jgi:putative acetyltransferase